MIVHQAYGCARAGVPSALRTLRQDPEALAQHTISCSMWRANPGYLARDGSQLASVAQQDYSWKEEEVCRASLLLGSRQRRRLAGGSSSSSSGACPARAVPRALPTRTRWLAAAEHGDRVGAWISRPSCCRC
jgi:hypothetical protein